MNPLDIIITIIPLNDWLLCSWRIIKDLKAITSCREVSINSIKVPFYSFDISQYILLPIYSFIRLLIYSFDVIHTLGFYSWGIKIDAIPGRINSASTLRLLWKGEYRGKCFELRGQGHVVMLLQSLLLLLYWFLIINEFIFRLLIDY